MEDLRGKRDVTIAFGPVGAAGALAVVLAYVRRSRPLAFLGLLAMAADLTVPQFRGVAAVRRREHSRSTA